ncbi:Altered inheritance of mitochondria protein 41 [Penicillium rolfsii]|nr:Altered inheritance of mitochondria protein 41 [Penicillium rolfsii]
MFQSMRVSVRVPLRSVRWNSTAGPTLPPLMATLRNDLKTAMRAKDTPRLNVLRALISETNNAAKTASPIQTDIQLLSLIRKRASASKEAAQQFAEADRPDLKEKEDAQIAILEEYAGHVKTLTVEEVEAVITKEIAAIKETGKKVEVGQVLKALFAPGGALDGKPADRKEVAGLVKKAVSA